MSSSKREEERNEKIIRGLMKLPPNRRCINCNSLGPQYVCSNFWTFVCMICSGIHREFTHRVKSVSMSKFTSQEVEALQNGGNQRARETYLKDWDLQRQRLPNISDVDKVREFIKAVYVDRKYAGGAKSEKPPKDSETEKNAVDDIRRASSYHSYSQSPPYDFQYEERLNRKQGGSLFRNPGSDRGLFQRKAASFVYSPGRFSDHLSEDRFANEGSSSRVSDYSVSSGGDPFRSAPQSPNLQRDGEISSPNFYSSKEVVEGLSHQARNSEVFAKKDADKVPVPRPQRTVSFGSIELFDKNSASLQSVGPVSLKDDSTGHRQPVVSIQDNLSSFAPCSQVPDECSNGLNRAGNPLPSVAHSSAPAVDLFQAPTTGSVASIDPFQSTGESSVLFQPSPPSSSSYFSGPSDSPSAANLNPKLHEQSETANDGWATFDLPQHKISHSNALNIGGFESHSKVGSYKSEDSVSSSNVGLEWFDFQNTPIHGPGPLKSNPWTGGLQNTHGPMNMGSSQPWNAFGEADGQQQHVNVQGEHLQVAVDDSSSAHKGHDLFSEDSTTDGLQNLTSSDGFSFPNLSSQFASGRPINQPIHPFMNNVSDIQQKSSNPFDIPFDSTFDASNSFLDTSSLQAALPITTLPSPCAVGLNDSWFPPNPIGYQGGMSYVTAQPPSPQLPNGHPTHGPAASVGGNPFA
ncbi:hypothetical protein RND81_06G195100 [Saponaria officinalis]|uniref:Arf-GAP domain-containing protein n=1 Tax=Saponaria officinalis TaxID=3572 RepID=A0AAW1KDF0_SAPOF